MSQLACASPLRGIRPSQQNGGEGEGKRLKIPRLRRSVGWILAGCAGLLLLWALRIHGPLPSSDPIAQADSLPGALASYTVTDTVHRGDTLAGLLLRNRMALTEIERVLREIRTHQYFSPRSILPGQVIEFTRDDAGELRNLRIRCSPEEIFVFEMSPDSLSSFAQAVECDVHVRKLGGLVQTTLEEAVISAGGERRLAYKLADVLSCEIDFFTEVHKGDRFGFIVEERFVEGAFTGYGDILYGWYDGKEADAAVAFFRGADPKGGYYDLDGRSLKRAFLKSPLNYRRISSSFSKARFHPILKRYRPHHGVDYAAATGTPVVALGDGTVEYAGWKGGYGKFVKIRHDRTYQTCYGHLSRFASGIRAGSKVKQGEKIGYVGKTGLATGPHLHFEVIEGGRSINPLAMKTVPSEPIPASKLSEYRELVGSLRWAESQMVAGSLLLEEEWRGLLAQNLAAATSESPAAR